MEPSERILRIEIPPCSLVRALSGNWEASLLNGWQLLSGIDMFWEGTIDLSGYALEYNTFFPAGGVMQTGPYWAEAGNKGTIVYTIVSSVPIDAATINANIKGATAPGFLNLGTQPGEQQDWDTVIYAESEIYVTNANITPNPNGILQLLSRQQSGSLSPTAAPILYVMKMVIGLSLFEGSTTMTIPASRILLPGVIGEEPDLEYIMRLKRSIELAD